MKYLKHYISLSALLLLYSIVGQAQTFGTGLYPVLSYSTDISEHFNYKAKVQNYFSVTDDGEWNVTHNKSDIQNFIGWKVTSQLKVAVGYQFRLAEKDKQNHRIIQEMSIKPKEDGSIFSHRIRTDQTLENGEDVAYRLRYRLSTDLPVEGDTIEQGEYFISFSEELLGGMQRSQESLENRFGLTIGKTLTNQHDIELGFSFRTEDVFTGNEAHKLWLLLGYYM